MVRLRTLFCSLIGVETVRRLWMSLEFVAWAGGGLIVGPINEHSGLPQVREKSGNFDFFQGQGKVREFLEK